ncbi:MAG: hypothetical protein R2879_20470 [Saprospiraceae bacterium]
MLEDLLKYFGIIARVLMILSLLLWAIYSKKWPESFRKLGPVLIINMIIEIASYSLSYFKIPNLFLLHLYTLLEFLAWTYFFDTLFKSNDWWQKWRFPFAAGVSILILLNTIFLESVNIFNSNAKTLSHIILISYCMVFFYQSFGTKDLNDPVQKGTTFLSFGILLYYLGSLFVFMFSNYHTVFWKSPVSQRAFWVINAFLTIIFQLIMLRSLWIVAHQRQNLS